MNARRAIKNVKLVTAWHKLTVYHAKTKILEKKKIQTKYRLVVFVFSIMSKKMLFAKNVTKNAKPVQIHLIILAKLAKILYLENWKKRPVFVKMVILKNKINANNVFTVV